MNIAVLVSGGVDSSVALALLQEQGHTVTAFYLKIWLEDELSFLGTCPWAEDLDYVEQVCKKLNVPLHIINLQQEYWDRVVSYTIAEVQEGRTPNPDVLCNARVKFEAFFEHIDISYDLVATGHYARVEQTISNDHIRTRLFMTPDSIKDQTYFLAHLNQSQLSRACFPLGALRKEEVRTLANTYDLPNKERKDSQGICFLGKIKFSEFIKYHIGEKEGEIREYETHTLLGTHKGFWFYTIGQRQGLGLGGGPWYVVAKDIIHNIVFISREYYAEDKKRDSFFVRNCSWISGTAPIISQLFVKLRHGPKRYTCTLTQPNQENHHRLLVTLDERDQGIAPGQFAVFYDGDECLGCGIID